MNTIKCKYCGREIEITEALQHQIEEKVLSDERLKHEQELVEAKAHAEEAALKKLQANFTTTIKQLEAEAKDERKRNKEFQDQIIELTKELRKARQEKEDARHEMHKKLVEEEEKIRGEERKRAEQEHRLKDAEKDKKLQDALKVNDELKRKLEQGSQQAQGEVLELELEKILKEEFPEDKIDEVKKGARGADVVQQVIDERGRSCGKILWESKNAKWSGTWIKKLREDQREASAQLAVLVVENPPEDVDTIARRDNVWITTPLLVAGLALALRENLVHLNHQRLASVGKNEKMEVLYEYLTGMEFKHRVESIVEAFTNLQEDIEKEKRWFNLKWARQEKEIRRIIDNTHGMYGDLQGVTGRQLQEIKPLEIEAEDGDSEDKDLAEDKFRPEKPGSTTKKPPTDNQLPFGTE